MFKNVQLNNKKSGKFALFTLQPSAAYHLNVLLIFKLGIRRENDTIIITGIENVNVD